MPPPCFACSHPTDAHYGICKLCQDKYIEAIAKGHVEKRARVVIELNPRASCRQERSARTRAPTLEAADLDPSSSSTRPASTRDLEAPVWPKVLHFAEIFASLDSPARAARFSPVPLRRLAGGAWAAGSRHRVAAARLAGVPVECRLVRKR